MKYLTNTEKNSYNQRFIPKLFFLILWLFSFSSIYAQTSSLYDLGEKVLTLIKSSTPEKVLDLVNVGTDLDKKATILESFITAKSTLDELADINKVQLFNTIQENDTLVYFILKAEKKFYILTTSLNSSNQITGDFNLLKTKVADQLAKGERVYKSRCYSCHGINGKGGLGPNLTDQYCKFVHSDNDLIDIISNGKKGTMMIAYKDYLTPEEIEDVALYVKSLRGKKTKNGKAKEGDIENPRLKIFNK